MYNLVFRKKSHYLMEFPPEKACIGLQPWWAFVMLFSHDKMRKYFNWKCISPTKKTKYIQSWGQKLPERGPMKSETMQIKFLFLLQT